MGGGVRVSGWGRPATHSLGSGGFGFRGGGGRPATHSLGWGGLRASGRCLGWGFVNLIQQLRRQLFAYAWAQWARQHRAGWLREATPSPTATALPVTALAASLSSSPAVDTEPTSAGTPSSDRLHGICASGEISAGTAFSLPQANSRLRCLPDHPASTVPDSRSPRSRCRR